MNIGGSEAHIDIYDDRMEIYSLGGMPDDSGKKSAYCIFYQKKSGSCGSVSCGFDIWSAKAVNSEELLVNLNFKSIIVRK